MRVAGFNFFLMSYTVTHTKTSQVDSRHAVIAFGNKSFPQDRAVLGAESAFVGISAAAAGGNPGRPPLWRQKGSADTLHINLESAGWPRA